MNGEKERKKIEEGKKRMMRFKLNKEKKMSIKIEEKVEIEIIGERIQEGKEMEEEGFRKWIENLSKVEIKRGIEK